MNDKEKIDAMESEIKNEKTDLGKIKKIEEALVFLIERLKKKDLI